MDAVTQAFDLMALVNMLIPVVTGIVSVPLFNLVKKRAVKWIDNQAPWLQQVLVTAQTWLLGSLSTLLGVGLPETFQGLTLDSTESLVAAGIAFAIHGGKKASEAKDSA